MDRKWTESGQKWEFVEQKVVKNGTKTKQGQKRDNKWTENGQKLDKGQKVDKKWETYIVNQHQHMICTASSES